VPDMVGRDERVAALTLRRVGLEVGTTARLHYTGASEGTVLAQDPPGHAQGIARPSINLLAAAPDDQGPDGFVMPDMVGRSVETAQAELTEVGIKTLPPTLVDVPVAPVGSGDAPPSLPVRPGAVLTQSPPAGARVDQNTVVALTAAQ
jgi:eukaryotic-like serine/threonine-protein kinase